MTKLETKNEVYPENEVLMEKLSPEELKYRQEMEALEREYHKLSLIGMCLESKLKVHELQERLKQFEPKLKSVKND